MSNRERRKAAVTERREARKAARRGRATQDGARSAAAGSSAAASADEHDPRAVEALTVGWMLSLLACLVSELGAVVGFVVVAAVGGAEQMPGLWALAPLVMAFIAWVTGTCCLVLTVIAGRMRRTAAPALVVRVAWIAGLLPWLAIVGLLMANIAA